jgi:hypothetical protein
VPGLRAGLALNTSKHSVASDKKVMVTVTPSRYFKLYVFLCDLHCFKYLLAPEVVCVIRGERTPWSLLAH